MVTETAAAPRRRNARGEGNQLRVDLLVASAELMATHGTVEGISLRAVARRAGVSATAVYRHFDDHTELLREAVDYCWQNFLDMLTTARDGAVDPFDAFERSGRGYAAFAAEHQGQYRVMFSNRIRLEGDRSSVADATFQILVDEVSGMLDALDDHRDAVFVAVQVHTWIHGIVDLMGCHPDMEWPPMEEQLNGLSRALGLLRPD